MMRGGLQRKPGGTPVAIKTQKTKKKNVSPLSPPFGDRAGMLSPNATTEESRA